MSTFETLGNVTRSSISIEEYEFREFLKDDVLVVGFLIFFCLIGSIGNGHALVVYYFGYKPSNHRTFVLWLAAVDFVACVVSIPFEIVDIRHGYTFGSSAACKTFRFINHIVNIGSGCLFGVIAIERFRKACRPFERQFSQKEAATSCMVTVGVSAFLSLPCFYIYEAAIKETDIPGLLGMDCTVGKDKGRKTFFRFFSGFLLLLSTVVFIICTVMYALIGKAMYKQISFRRSAQLAKSSRAFPSVNSIDSSLKNSSQLAAKNGEKQSIQREESSVCLENNRKVHFVNSNDSSASKIQIRGAAKLDRTKRITLMFLVATAVSYIGIVPNIIILMIKALNAPAYRRIDSQLGLFTPVLLRWYFLSNVTNPVVYCFVDDRFRQECKRLYGNVTNLWKNKGQTRV
ncbi:hypothetical protein FSP39_007368 [Pinctada imbricata]|uniref:G-protein coupled receptors family 1 profile domain-containing protein n=1 Tax=Pinctada imbricata TaxID=66713 RepID=A0AA88XKM7_PINIB|nr:hypothetical protein FSP39_007368 [Pinctada imbricata]